MVEHQLPKLRAAGSIPVTRSSKIKASVVGSLFLQPILLQFYCNGNKTVFSRSTAFFFPSIVE